MQQELSCYEDLVGTTNETAGKEENNEPVPFEETEIGIADSKEQIPEIPEDSSVQFIGGHINMINKLKLVHPDWTYVTDDTSGPSPTFNPRKKLTCVIIYSTHMSHSLFDSVYDKVPKDVPVLYVTAVNLDLLEAQIHASWDKEQIRLREMKKTEQRQEIST